MSPYCTRLWTSILLIIDVLVAANQAGRVVMNAQFLNDCERLVGAMALA
jgi:hypothetical protein